MLNDSSPGMNPGMNWIMTQSDLAGTRLHWKFNQTDNLNNWWHGMLLCLSWVLGIRAVQRSGWWTVTSPRMPWQSNRILPEDKPCTLPWPWTSHCKVPLIMGCWQLVSRDTGCLCSPLHSTPEAALYRLWPGVHSGACRHLASWEHNEGPSSYLKAFVLHLIQHGLPFVIFTNHVTSTQSPEIDNLLTVTIGYSLELSLMWLIPTNSSLWW